MAAAFRGRGNSPVKVVDQSNDVVGRLFELGFTDVRQLGRILLTGAMVAPVWLALRLLDSGGRR